MNDLSELGFFFSLANDEDLPTMERMEQFDGFSEGYFRYHLVCNIMLWEHFLDRKSVV